MTIRLTRRAALGTALAAPAIWGRDAVAQIRRGDELTVGVWGGAQERIVREFCATPLERQHGVRINFVLGGTPERRARAYAERGGRASTWSTSTSSKAARRCATA
jgi:putative spermidine/putrescine transport system substrate-binding protein